MLLKLLQSIITAYKTFKNQTNWTENDLLRPVFKITIY